MSRDEALEKLAAMKRIYKPEYIQGVCEDLACPFIGTPHVHAKFEGLHSIPPQGVAHWLYEDEGWEEKAKVTP